MQTMSMSQRNKAIFAHPKEVKEYMAEVGRVGGKNKGKRKRKAKVKIAATPIVREYYGIIGMMGGAISKRTITPEQQRRMQEAKKAKRAQKS